MTVEPVDLEMMAELVSEQISTQHLSNRLIIWHLSDGRIVVHALGLGDDAAVLVHPD